MYKMAVSRVLIIVDIPIHQVFPNEIKDRFEVEYHIDNTINDLYGYLLKLGYSHPLYKLYRNYDVLQPNDLLLSELLNPLDTLYLNDPVRRRPVATVAVIGAVTSK